MDIIKFLNLPPVASSHGHEIDMVIYLLHILMVVLFIGWGLFFVIALVRFNKWMHPKADYIGVKSHISTYLEVGVALFEALLLIGFALPFWAKQVNAFPNRKDTVEVRVVAEQFAWNVHYPGKDKVFGNTNIKFFDKQANPLGLDPNDPFAQDDITTINQLYLPIGKPAIIHLTSKDVIHSFALPIMRVKQDVMPGLSVPTWFTPTSTGTSEIACAQLCGIGHYRMRGTLHVVTKDEFDAWLAKNDTSSGGGDESSGNFDDFWN